jgi:hypothetical protein
MTQSPPRSHLRLAAASITVSMAGCATAPQEPNAWTDTAWAKASRLPARTEAAPDAQWMHQRLPGKAAVLFAPERVDGRAALLAKADSAASVLRHHVRIEPADLDRLRFSWKVPQLIADADIGRRESDDSPVRVILAFEGDRSKFSARDSMLSELMRALTGEEMPYATLMYVWCNKRPAGTVVASPRTDRIRKMVLESGPGRLNQWLDYERDIRADYERAFGEAPGALVGIAIMTDSDNTKSTAKAWYGPVRVTTSARR